MNKEKMGRDKVENGKKSKATADTMKTIVDEKQKNVNVINCLNYVKFIILFYILIV